MIPLLYISGVDLLAPRLWPMGTGAPRPRALQLLHPISWRAEFDWNDAAQLIEVRHSIAPGAVLKHEVYVWRNDELDRICYFDAELVEVYGDKPVSEELWTWSNGRPVETRNISTDDGQAVTWETWDWSADGETLIVSESSSRGLLTRTTATLDGNGCAVRIERVHTLDPRPQVIEVEWSAEGRILSAVKRVGPALEHSRRTLFRWDDGGRLIAQADGDAPDVDVYRYEYEP
jgi:hypothetical protein